VLGVLIMTPLVGSVTAAAFGGAAVAGPTGVVPTTVKVVSYTPTLETPAELVTAAAQAAALVEDNPSAYEGSYYDPNTKTVVLEATPDASRVPSQATVLRANPSIVVRAAHWSRSDAESRFADFLVANNLTDRVMSWWVDPKNDGFQLFFIGQPTNAELASFAQAPGPVTIVAGMINGGTTTDAMNDPSPVAGGSRYYAARTGPVPYVATWDHRCTAGYGYKIGGTDYILTAGHCFWRGITPWDEYWRATGPNGSPTFQARMGDFGGKSTWNKDTGTVNAGDDNALHGDLSLVNMTTDNQSVGDSIWVSNSDKRFVTAREAPAQGNPVCRSGTTSFELCGFTINATNVNHTYSDGTTIKNGDFAQHEFNDTCVEPGDSGGPVYRQVGASNATAVGVISGTFPIPHFGCNLVFTGVEEAIQAWGGGLNLH
jgi:V8-like Glu-specific endopeptidase